MIPEDAIRLRSYFIWKHAGCPDGKSDEHWQRAVAELEAEKQASLLGLDDRGCEVAALPTIRRRPRRLTAQRLAEADDRRMAIAARR